MILCFRCPGCQKKFRMEASEVGRFCVMCGYDTAPDEVIERERFEKMLALQQPPHYQKSIKKTTDDLYRNIETASEVRVQQAAEMAGVDTSEMASLKVTDLKDNLRYGDTAHVATQAAKVAEQNLQMPAIPGKVGFNRDPQINNFRSGSSVGPYAHSGLGSMAAIQNKIFGRTPEHFSGKPTQ